MKKIFLSTLILWITQFSVISQITQILPLGYPDRSSNMDILHGFKNPPKGCGNVAFYWWQGDTLTRERLTWQLDRLKNKVVTSLQINYSHLDEDGITYSVNGFYDFFKQNKKKQFLEST